MQFQEYPGEQGYDPQFGARPIKRVIQKKVLNELSKQLLGDKIQKDTPIVADVFEDKVVFRNPIKDEIESIKSEKV